MLMGRTLAKEIQFPAESHVGALQVRHVHRLVRSRSRSLEENVALFDLIQHVVRKSLHLCDSVFESQPFDGSHLDLSGSHIICEKFIKHLSGGFHDDRTDAVSVDKSDNNFIQS